MASAETLTTPFAPIVMPDTVGLIENVFVSVPPEYEYAVVESALPEVVIRELFPPLIDNCALIKIVI